MQERISKGNASNILNVCNSKVHVAYNQNVLFWEEQSKYLNSTQSKYVAEGEAQDTWASTSPQGRGPLGWLMSSSPSPLHRGIQSPLLVFPLGSPLVRACMSRWAKWRADPWIPRFGPWGLGLGLGLHGVGRRDQRWLLRLLFYRVYPVFSCDWLQNRDRHCKTLVLFKRRCMQWLRWKNYYKLLMIKMITSGEPGCASARWV